MIDVVVIGTPLPVLCRHEAADAINELTTCDHKKNRYPRGCSKTSGDDVIQSRIRQLAVLKRAS